MKKIGNIFFVISENFQTILDHCGMISSQDATL